MWQYFSGVKPMLAHQNEPPSFFLSTRFKYGFCFLSGIIQMLLMCFSLFLQLWFVEFQKRTLPRGEYVNVQQGCLNFSGIWIHKGQLPAIEKPLVWWQQLWLLPHIGTFRIPFSQMVEVKLNWKEHNILWYIQCCQSHPNHLQLSAVACAALEGDLSESIID